MLQKLVLKRVGDKICKSLLFLFIENNICLSLTCEDIVEDELGDEEFVAAHLAGHAALQLNSLVVVDVVQLLQNLSKKSSEKLFPRFSRNNDKTLVRSVQLSGTL
jgi:hypothetical protein